MPRGFRTSYLAGWVNKSEVKAHLDVTHYRKITNDELNKIEQKVNEYIMSNLPVTTEILPRNLAESRYGFSLYQGGAVPGKELRVVSMGHVDTEACGGTHTMHSQTGEIGCFKIIKRESIQDGVERISYKCGSVAIAYMQEKEKLLSDASDVLSVSESELVKSINRFFGEWKEQRKKIEDLSELLIREEAKEIIANSSLKPVLRVLDIDDSLLRKLGIKISESETACGCFISKSGTIVCAAGKNSEISAKSLLEKAISSLGGTGGGNEHLSQGRVKKIEVFDFD